MLTWWQRPVESKGLPRDEAFVVVRPEHMLPIQNSLCNAAPATWQLWSQPGFVVLRPSPRKM